MSNVTLPLSDEQREFRKVAERFAREKLAPAYQARELEAKIDRALLREMGALGLIAPDLPDKHGGLGQTSETSGLIMEAIAYGDPNVAYVQLLSSLCGQILAKHASDALAGEWLPRIVSGESLFALALTEPRGGSDAANLALSARRSNRGFVLNGEKTSISLAVQADAVLVFARTGKPEDGAHGISAFLVPMDAPGISTSRLNDFGSKVVGRGSIFFDDVQVPSENMLGGENKGFVQVMQGFDFSRALIGLQCIGPAQASLDETWKYVSGRQAFGAALSRNQGVTFPLAEGESMAAAVRQLCYQTLRLRDAGEPHTAEAAMCKWLGPKTAVDIIHQCLLTHGHYGWSLDLPHQQRLRDIMGLEIGDGTAQIMKYILAREMLKRHA